jgi:hypothetical protein
VTDDGQNLLGRHGGQKGKTKKGERGGGATGHVSPESRGWEIIKEIIIFLNICVAANQKKWKRRMFHYISEILIESDVTSDEKRSEAGGSFGEMVFCWMSREVTHSRWVSIPSYLFLFVSAVL